MQDHFFRWLTAHPFWVMLLSLLFVVCTSLGVQRLFFVGDYRVFFSEDNPQLIAYESIQKIYSKSDNVSIVILPDNGQIFTPEHITAIRELTEAAWQIPYSTRVDSITNYQHTYSDEDDLVVEDLVLEETELTTENLSRIKQVAINEPRLVNKLIAPEANAAMINVTIHLPGKGTLTEEPEVAAKVRQLQVEFETKHPDVKIHLAGMTMMNVSFTESAMKDNAVLVPVMFFMVIMTIAVLLRTVTGTFSIVVIIATSIAATMGLAGWAGAYLTGASASAPIMILTLVVADCIHILTSLFYEMRQGTNKRTAIQQSLKINLKPIFLTSVTTAIGFLSMNFSDSPPFQSLGNMVALGVMLAFVFSVTLFPALLQVLPLKVKVREDNHHTSMDHLAVFVITKRKILLPVMSIIVIGFGAIAPTNILNDDPIGYFDDAIPIRIAANLMSEHLSGMTTFEVSIDSLKENGINNPSFIKTLGEFTQWMRQQSETDHVNSLSDTFKRLNQNMHNDSEDWYRLPDEQAMAAQYLLLYEMSLPYGLDLTNQINVNKSATRVVTTLKNINSTQLLELENRVKNWFKTHAPSYQVSITSPNLMFAHIAQRNIVSMLFGTIFALLLISLLLGIALKSVRYCILSLIPNLAPAAIGFGFWALWEGEVNMGLSIVVGMTLGIVVDDTVHFLSKYKQARDENNLNAEQAVRYAFSSVGRALWITTLVLFLGFMSLAQSDFQLNSGMGLLTAIIILLALVIDFLLLPAILIKFDHLLHPNNLNVQPHKQTIASANYKEVSSNV